MSDLKTTGNLFVNDYRKTEKQPAYTGSLEVSREQIEALINKGKAGEDVKLKLSCWIYPSKRNPEEDRLFLVADASDFDKKKSSNGWNDTPF